MRARQRRRQSFQISCAPPVVRELDEDGASSSGSTDMRERLRVGGQTRAPLSTAAQRRLTSGVCAHRVASPRRSSRQRRAARVLRMKFEMLSLVDDCGSTAFTPSAQAGSALGRWPTMRLCSVRSTSTWSGMTRCHVEAGRHNDCYGLVPEITRGRSDRGSSPWSRQLRSPGRTAPARPSFRRPPPGPGAGSSSRARDRRACRST